MIKANGTHIILEAIKEDKSKSGIISVDDETDPVQKGKIISVGNEIKDKALKVGKTLIFSRPHGFEFEYDYKKYLYIKYEAAKAVLD